MKTDYTALDAALLARIKQKPANFTELQSGDVQKESIALAKAGPSGKPSLRYVDARLQVLRKAGKITYSGKTGWSIAP